MLRTLFRMELRLGSFARVSRLLDVLCKLHETNEGGQ